MAAFDIEGARKEGYSDKEIAEHLAKGRKFDLAGARKEGYSDTDIIGHLAKEKPKTDREARIESIPGMPAGGDPEAENRPRSLRESLYGAGEAGLAAGATSLAAIADAFAKVGAGAINKATGSKFNPQILRDVGAYVQPQTEAGQESLSDIGKFVDATKIAGLGPNVGTGPGAVLGGSALSQIGSKMTPRMLPGLDAAINAKPEPSAIPGFGSAMTPQALIRRERAAALDVPINLTKGQAERSFEQLKFEKETAKQGKVGAPLRERAAENNEKIWQNLDSWIEDTGAQAPDLRATGKVVTEAIAEKAKKAKQQINAAYDQARSANEMSEPVDVRPLIKFAEDNKAESVNAGVIPAVRGTVAKLSTPAKKDVFGQEMPRTMSINDIEEVRKMVNRTAMAGGPNQNKHFGQQLLGIIDGITEGKGGEHYQRARALNTRYKNEFENVGVVDKLMSTKPGTKDRAVAYEDVFDHSIRSGSLDDTRMIRKTLQTAGPQGEQAWKELQAQGINYLKDAATKSERDIRGNPVVSFAGLNKAVNAMDKDGKLDFIYGKQGAQKIRDLRDAAADLYTVPEGSVNYSNTASALLEAFGHMTVGHLPTAAAKAVSVGRNLLRERGVRKQISESLDMPKNGMNRIPLSQIGVP